MGRSYVQDVVGWCGVSGKSPPYAHQSHLTLDPFSVDLTALRNNPYTTSSEKMPQQNTIYLFIPDSYVARWALIKILFW